MKKLIIRSRPKRTGASSLKWSTASLCGVIFGKAVTAEQTSTSSPAWDLGFLTVEDGNTIENYFMVIGYGLEMH